MKKKKKNLPKLEEPPSAGLGSRLLRRLSKRDREGRSSHPDGHDNYAFEMEAPKSPWRYPHLMFRNDSKKSKAVSFRNHQGRNQLEVPGIGFGEFRQTLEKDRQQGQLLPQPHRPRLPRPLQQVQTDRLRVEWIEFCQHR